MKMRTIRRSYKKKLLLYFSGVFAVFAIVLVAFQIKSEKDSKKVMLQERLAGYADIIAQSEDYDYIHRLLPAELRITVINKDGEVRYDSSMESADSLDNHSFRPEIRLTFKNSEGYSIRKSDTTGKDYFYYAKSYGGFIVRVALPYEIDVKRFFRPDFVFLMIVFLIFLVALFSLIFLADRFGEAVERLHHFAEAAQKGNVDYDSIEFPDSELGEIGAKMVENYRRIESSNNIIALEKERLLLHFHYFDGGIAIFSPGKEKGYANSKFIQYVNTLLDRPTPDLNDIWKSEIFAPLNEFFNHNTPVRSDSAPVFQFKAEKGGRKYSIQMLIYPDSAFEVTINDVSEFEKNRLVKQQMTNNIAHELRTPVSSIRGYLETLKNCPDIAADRKQAFIDRAYLQAMRLSDLIRDIALITKIEEAPEQLNREKVMLRTVTDEIFEEFRDAVEEKGITVENLIDMNLSINGNSSLIYAIFRNLIENSIKYAGRSITLHMECYAQNDGFLHFSYYDTGAGVSEEHLTRIFERFYRVSEGRTRDDGGSGLGLSIVRNAVAFHKGDIRAVNRKGGGLEFIFSLSSR